MMPDTRGNAIQRHVEPEALTSALSPTSVRVLRRRLERILGDDREMLIALQCQLDQIHGDSRLSDDDGDHQLPH